MMKRSFSFLRLLAAAACACTALPALARDLMGTYELALQHDPTLHAASAALAAGREKAVQGRSLLLPQVGLTASYTHVHDRSDASVPPALAGVVSAGGTGSAHQVALQATQPLYDVKARTERRQAEHQAALAELQWRSAQQDLMQRAAAAHVNVLLAGEALQVVQSERAAVQMHRDRAQARFDVGRGRITELQEAQARLDAVATREVSARSTLALRQAQYEALTGATAMGLAALPSALQPTPPQPDSVAEWQALGRAQQPRVQAKALELAIATAEIEKHALAARPTLDLVGSMTLKGQGGSLTSIATPQERRTAAVGLQFTVPLFAGGALDSKQREAMARRDEAEQSLAAARRDAALQVEDAFLGVHTGMARIASLEQSVRSARTALDATTLGRDVGTRTDPDVLDAQQRLHAALLDLAQARGDWLLGRIRLAQSAGVLQESDLRALNAHLHP
jgi:outer membrane protein